MRIFIFLFLTLLLVNATSAQDVELVVTATKEPTPPDTLPVGVTVLDQEALKDKATVADALGSTLAVRLTSQVPGQQSLTAPGFGENGFGRVLLLLDGFSQNSPDMSPYQPLNLIPVFTLDRIEILQGPGSSMYGTGALAGAVNLITRTPKKFEAEVSTSLESTLTNRQSLSAGVPVGAGGLLITAQRDQDIETRDRSNSDSYQVWSKFSYPVTEGALSQNLQVWGAFSTGSFQLPGSITQAEFDANPDKASNPNDLMSPTETKGGGLYSFQAADWKVDLPLSATYRAVRFQTPSNPSYSDSKLFLINLEPRAKISLGRFLGADVEWSTSLGIQAVRLVSDLYDQADSTFSNVIQEAVVQRWTGSLVNHLEAAWEQKWFAEASLRGEMSRTTAASDQNSVISGQRDFFPLSGDLGMSWLPLGGLKVGAQLSRIYRYPFTDEMIGYQSTTWNFFSSDIDAEVGHSLSVSSSYSNGPMKISMSGTATRMENEVVYTTRNENAGPTYHGSSLVSVEAKPVNWGSLGGEYAYELARFASGDNDGKTVPVVPSHRGRVWTKAAWEGVGSAEVSWSLSSPYYAANDFANTQGLVHGKQIIDVSLSTHFGNPDFSFTLYGKNLSDDRTPVFATDYGTRNNYPTAGRVFGTSVSLKL